MELEDKAKINSQTICKNCGHYYFLHEPTFDLMKYECAACDDPSIPIEKKCPGFKE